MKTFPPIPGGPSDDPRSTASEAQAAREEGVHIFVVGVGSFVSEEEMESVASQPPKDFTFLVPDPQNLSSVGEPLTASICRRTPMSIS